MLKLQYSVQDTNRPLCYFTLSNSKRFYSSSELSLHSLSQILKKIHFIQYMYIPCPTPCKCMAKIHNLIKNNCQVYYFYQNGDVGSIHYIILLAIAIHYILLTSKWSTICFMIFASSLFLCRDFLEKYYVGMKKEDPAFPFLVRECSGMQPKLFARYGNIFIN